MKTFLLPIVLLFSVLAHSQDLKLLKRVSFAFSYDEVERYCRDAGYSFRTSQKQTEQEQCTQFYVFDKTVSYYTELIIVMTKCSDESLNPINGVRFMTRNEDIFYRIKDECINVEHGKAQTQKTNDEGDLISTYDSGSYYYSFKITKDQGVKAYVIEVRYNRPF